MLFFEKILTVAKNRSIMYNDHCEIQEIVRCFTLFFINWW